MSEKTKLLVESIQRIGVRIPLGEHERVEQIASAIFEAQDDTAPLASEPTPTPEPDPAAAANTAPTPAPQGANTEELRDKSISTGTMLAADLIPKFVAVLKQYNPEEAKQYEASTRRPSLTRTSGTSLKTYSSRWTPSRRKDATSVPTKATVPISASGQSRTSQAYIRLRQTRGRTAGFAIFQPWLNIKNVTFPKRLTYCPRARTPSRMDRNRRYL